MTNSFLNRVTAERSVLKAVNADCPRNKQLTGLSSLALTQWMSSLGIEKGSKASIILETLSGQCQRLSDRSNETFSPLEQSNSEEIKINITRLTKELESLKPI